MEFEVFVFSYQISRECREYETGRGGCIKARMTCIGQNNLRVLSGTYTKVFAPGSTRSSLRSLQVIAAQFIAATPACLIFLTVDANTQILQYFLQNQGFESPLDNSGTWQMPVLQLTSRENIFRYPLDNCRVLKAAILQIYDGIQNLALKMEN